MEDGRHRPAVLFLHRSGKCMTALKLYQSDLSPYAVRVRILAHAKGVKLECLPPPGGLKSADYLAINPLGKVPCLVTDDAVIPESEVICEFLEDSFPSPTLRPVDPEARARTRLLSRMADLYIGGALTKLFGQMRFKTRDAAITDAAFVELETAFDRIAHFLEGPDYAVGHRLSLADCTLVPLLFLIDARIAPVFRRPSPITGKLKTYFDGARKDPHIAKGLSEMQTALEAYAKAQAAG
jgi:glutathione S-transferase